MQMLHRVLILCEWKEIIGNAYSFLRLYSYLPTDNGDQIFQHKHRNFCNAWIVLVLKICMFDNHSWYNILHHTCISWVHLKLNFYLIFQGHCNILLQNCDNSEKWGQEINFYGFHPIRYLGSDSIMSDSILWIHLPPLSSIFLAQCGWADTRNSPEPSLFYPF